MVGLPPTVRNKEKPSDFDHKLIVNVDSMPESLSQQLFWELVRLQRRFPVLERSRLHTN